MSINKHLVEINNRVFYFSIQKIENCLFSRRLGIRGIRLFGHSFYLTFKRKL